MAATEIGKVKSGKGNTFYVRWDEKTRDVYVKGVGGFFGGGDSRKCDTKASTARDAMNVAEAFVRDR